MAISKSLSIGLTPEVLSVIPKSWLRLSMENIISSDFLSEWGLTIADVNVHLLGMTGVCRFTVCSNTAAISLCWDMHPVFAVPKKTSNRSMFRNPTGGEPMPAQWYAVEGKITEFCESLRWVESAYLLQARGVWGVLETGGWERHSIRPMVNPCREL